MPPVNEPNLSYLPGSPERAALKARLSAMASERIEIPLIIGGREIRTGHLAQVVMPHDHRHVLADWHRAEPLHVVDAMAAANEERGLIGPRQRSTSVQPSSSEPRICSPPHGAQH